MLADYNLPYPQHINIYKHNFTGLFHKSAQLLTLVRGTGTILYRYWLYLSFPKKNRSSALKKLRNQRVQEFCR